MRKVNRVQFVFAAVVLLTLGALAVVMGNERKTATQSVTYTEFLKMAEKGEIERVVLTDSPKLEFYGKDSKKMETDNPRSASFKEEMLKMGVKAEEGTYVSTEQTVQTVLSLAFFIGVIFFVTRSLSKRAGCMVTGFDLADAAKRGEKTLFDDVAGNTEAKESIKDIVDFIKNPAKYDKYGARMPRGVIFYGAPGTGKTLMAKAVAGEAGVPFYAVSGSDFVQMYVGVGAGRVRELFKKARESGKAVIFIDEIDALAKKRSSAAVGGNDERDQTLNALLTEMSGFSGGEGIVVIAATNRLDTIDEALLRPGRFDRQLEIGLPDVKARREILELYAKNKPLAQDVNLEEIAKTTMFFSGAMLENLMNEAAIFAAKENEDKITTKDVDKAYYEVIAGSEKKDRSGILERDRVITAFHESGHALAAKLVSPENSVQKVTIIPSSKGAGGFCLNIPPEKMYVTKREIESKIVVSLAGRAAEEIIFGQEEITTGASSDLEKASALITDYITKFAMSDNISDMGQRSPLMYVRAAETGGNAEFFREHSAQMERFYLRAKTIIEANLPKLQKLAEALLQHESLDEKHVDELLKA